MVSGVWGNGITCEKAGLRYIEVAELVFMDDGKERGRNSKDDGDVLGLCLYHPRVSIELEVYYCER